MTPGILPTISEYEDAVYEDGLLCGRMKRKPPRYASHIWWMGYLAGKEVSKDNAPGRR